MTELVKLFSAPLQGYTEAVWRHCHADIYGGVDSYFTPFARVEKGEVRKKDIRDIVNPLNDNHKPIAQIIFRDINEFSLLCDWLMANGVSHIDLNLGCPFVPQVKKGRGAAVVANPALLAEVSRLMTDKYGDISFSLKMRPGVADVNEWKSAASIISSMPLTHITVHPRTARQQYAGDISFDTFAEIASSTRHKIVFNGNISSPSDIDSILSRFPDLHGVMVGRGLLARPSVFCEWREGSEWSQPRRSEALYEFHDRILKHYDSTLCGDAQILCKIKPFWDYLESEIGHKAIKAIGKATTVRKYLDAVSRRS